MRIAYLLMVHREPQQVQALLRALPADSPVFVHIDARVRQSMFDTIAALAAERPFTLVRRHRCYWGRIGMVRATLELVRTALVEDSAWEYASLLSGADYPILSNVDLAALLQRRKGEEFISSWDMRADVGNPWKHAPGRMQSDSRVDRRHIGAGRRIVRSPWTRSMPYGLHPYGGSQWWTLSRDALAFLIGYVRTHPKLLRFMRGVFVPDECFVQTVLGNSQFRESLAGDDLRFVEWGRPQGPWPAVLGEEDIPAMQSSGKAYARKFDLRSAPGVLAAIEIRLRGGVAAD